MVSLRLVIVCLTIVFNALVAGVLVTEKPEI